MFKTHLWLILYNIKNNYNYYYVKIFVNEDLFLNAILIFFWLSY